MPSAPPHHPTPWERGLAVGEWAVTIGLAVTVAWTTLCLGGYLAETMVAVSVSVLGLTAVAVVLWAVRSQLGASEFNWAVLLPLPFLLYALASVIWLAPARWLAWREWLLWLQMWLVFALVLHVGRGKARTAVVVATFVGLALAGVGMAAYQRFIDPTWMMLGRTQADQFVGRSAGMFGIPNSLAGLFELVAPACFCLVFARSISMTWRILAAWLAALLVFALVLTGSRGGWISLSLTLALWPFLGTADWRRKFVAMIAVIAVTGLGLWALYHGSGYARERIQPFLEGRFEASRPIIWKVAVQLWQEEPWLGRGAASYNVLFDQHRPRGFLNEPVWAHNDYLNTLSDYGLIGFALWVGMGAMLLGLGWRAVRRARREAVSGDLFASARWRLGLLLGLIAFMLHLAVDFHTKLPALAFAAAVSAGVLLREEPWLQRTLPRAAAVATATLLVALLATIGWRLAWPMYRAEAMRYEARRMIDRHANYGVGDLDQIVPVARAGFTRAVRLDPTNGQAWADLAYATEQSWRLPGADRVSLGRYAELAADRALQLCPVNAEFWVRKGTALDLQRGRAEAESCYQRAVALAPNTAVWWYYYAFHLQRFSNRKSDALRAVETCLSLDRSYSGADTLRQQLVTGR